MTYATQDDMVARFGETELLQLTDDTDTGKIGPRLAVALADAHQIIDGYVAGIYAVPLTPVPDLVKRWVCDITRYYLHRDAVPDLVEKNFKAAMSGVSQVARGDMTLACAGVEAEEDPAADDLATYDDAPSIMANGPWGQ